MAAAMLALTGNFLISWCAGQVSFDPVKRGETSKAQRAVYAGTCRVGSFEVGDGEEEAGLLLGDSGLQRR